MPPAQFSLWERVPGFFTGFRAWGGSRPPQALSLILGVLLPLGIFAILVWEVQVHPMGLWGETALLLGIHQMANPGLDHFVAIATRLGTRWGVLPVSLVLMGWLGRSRHWPAFIYLLITLPGSLLINHWAKAFWHRSRPALWAGIPPHLDASFPSGHAMVSMTFVAAVVILTRQTSWRKWVVGGGGLFVLFIGWTRLYLGVHFPSDILAGWMLAFAWAVGVSLGLGKDGSFYSLAKCKSPEE